MIIIKLRFLPYENLQDNVLELYNELTLMVISILLFPMCDYIQDLDTRYNLGWAIVFLTFLFLFINIGCVFIKIILLVAMKIKDILRKWVLMQKVRKYN